MEFTLVADMDVWLPGTQVWLLLSPKGKPEPAVYRLLVGDKQGCFRLLGGREVSELYKGLQWAPLEIPSKHGETPHADDCRCSDCTSMEVVDDGGKYYVLYSSMGIRSGGGYNEQEIWLSEIELIFGDGMVGRERFTGASSAVILDYIRILKKRGYTMKEEVPPEVITKGELREVLKGMNSCFALVEGVHKIVNAHLDGNYRGATEAMFDIAKVIDNKSTREALSEAQRLYEKYDESSAVTMKERSPLTGRALELAATKFMEELTWSIYGDLHMERTVKEIREEHEATWPPEVVAYVREQFAKEGSRL